MSYEPIFTPPTADEIETRRDRVRALMEQQGLDYYVATCPDNVFYLTNFANYVHERPFILVLPRTGTPRFVVPKLEVPHVLSRRVGELDIVPYREFPAPAGETWIDSFTPLFGGGGAVGVESICPLQVYEATPGDRRRTDVVDDARMVKTPYEIGRIVYACERVSETHAELMAMAKPGLMAADASGALSRGMSGRLLQDVPTANLLATSIFVLFQPPSVSHDPHNFTNIFMEMEEGGPHVSLINCRLNGYGAEIERTFFLGSVPEAAKRPFETMMEARYLALELTRPGANMGEVDARVNAVFEKAGYGDNLLHRTSHSIGVTGHEAPFLAEGYDREIEPSMFYTIEPGVYLEGIGGFRHSDTIMTTEDGNRILTKAPDDLGGLTLPLP